MSTKKDKVQVSFVGNMAEEVTGSCTKIEYKDNVVLFDFGLIQSGHTVLENYKLNKTFLKKIRPTEVTAVVISHNHADHVALVPYLFKDGKCNANVYVAKNASCIMREMLLDCAHIMERDCELLSNQRDKYVEPFYTEDDVNKAMSHVVEVESFTPTEIGNGISITFYPNSHILLSQQCEMVFDTVPVKKRLLFTGDLGNLTTLSSKYYMEDFYPVQKADFVVAESTYGNPEKRNLTKDYKKDIEKMETVIRQFCCDMNGRVLLPTFSLDRMPFVMSLLYDIFSKDETFDVPIIIDAPLAIRLLRCYSDILVGDKKKRFDQIMSWKNFKFISDAEESKACVEDKTPKVILSSSGMLTAGRSVFYLKSILPRANDCILFAGFTSEGTLGAKIKHSDHQKTITVQQKEYKNRCAIVQIHSFSGHMQNNDLVDYYSNIKCEKIYLVHGDPDAKVSLKKSLEDVLASKYKTTKVVQVNKSTKISFG